VQKLSLANASIAYSLVLADHPVAARIVSGWAKDVDHLYAKSRGKGAGTSLLARATLRALLVAVTAKTDWHFESDARGRLSVTSDDDGGAGPQVSLTHTRGAIACALAISHPIGIDLERHRPRDYRSIAQYAFGPREQSRIEREGEHGFYRVWTVREAIAKATGQGLALVTDGRDRADVGPALGSWTTRCDSDDWYLVHAQPAPDMSLAIAVAGIQGEPEIVIVSAEELVERTCST
jgi:4'-phosphopantetheinyl transferase